MSDPVTRLNAALEGRYAIERELGAGGMVQGGAEVSTFLYMFACIKSAKTRNKVRQNSEVFPRFTLFWRKWGVPGEALQARGRRFDPGWLHSVRGSPTGLRKDRWKSGFYKGVNVPPSHRTARSSPVACSAAAGSTVRLRSRSPGSIVRRLPRFAG